ncbi:transglutaminase family protein [Thermodesulfobacteriota bacterium]
MVDFSQFQDRPLTDEVSEWLKPGKQSAVTPVIADAAARISGMNRRERLYKAVEYFGKNFKYDNWYNDKAFSRTADMLFQNRLLGGCSDYALVQMTLFRALGIPARLVITANVDWMLAYQANDLLIFKGHVFVEVFLEDRWFLVDSVYLLLFNDYNPLLPCYPRREYFFARCRDYWDIGITDISKLNNILKQKTLGFNEELYTDPQYPQNPII